MTQPSPIIVKRQIDLSKADGCKHPDITATAHYLVRWNTEWILGTFEKQWYGWNFVWPLALIVGFQLDSTSISEVWEVELRDLTHI